MLLPLCRTRPRAERVDVSLWVTFSGFCAVSIGAHRELGKLGARGHRAPRSHDRHRLGDARGSVVSREGFFEDLLVQGQTQDRLAKPSILRLKISQTSRLTVAIQAFMLPPTSGSVFPKVGFKVEGYHSPEPSVIDGDVGLYEGRPHSHKTGYQSLLGVFKSRDKAGF